MKTIKVRVKNKEEVKAVQEAWFKQGYTWADGLTNYYNYPINVFPFLFLHEGKGITCGSEDDLREAVEVSIGSILNPKKLTPHVHCELIKAWADGEVIQIYSESRGNWYDDSDPMWCTDTNYRIKPEPVKSPQELEKESILEEMEKLKQRLNKLEV